MTTAAAVIGGVVALVLIAGVATFVFQHHSSEVVSGDAAAAEFARVRARFADQSALVEIRDGAEPVVSRRPAAHANTSTPKTLYSLVFDSRTRKLLRSNLPLSVLRLTHPNGFRYVGEVTFLDDTEFDSDLLILTLNDIEAHGPGLILHHSHADGGQIIVWSQ